MRYLLGDECERERLEFRLRRLAERGAVVDVREVRPTRSLPQNSYLHLLLQIFAAEYGCSPEEAKIDYYKRLCNRDLYEVVVTNKYGRRVRTLRSSTELDTAQMSQSIDRFRAWAARGGIELPDADNLRGIDLAMVKASKVEWLMREIDFKN